MRRKREEWTLRRKSHTNLSKTTETRRCNYIFDGLAVCLHFPIPLISHISTNSYLICACLDGGRQCLWVTTMDLIGAVLTRSYGCASQGILVMVAMETGQEELESWRLPNSHSP